VQDDPDNLIGNRWLCRGGSVLFVAQSGIGKSTLLMQLSCGWALADRERSMMLHFGIKPVKPLKILIVQAENDKGDLAEMLQGVVLHSGGWIDKDCQKLLAQRLVFVRNEFHSGEAFLRTFETLVELHKPDLAWIDPLLSYIGADIADQAEVTGFTNRLNQIKARTGVVVAVVHHKAKPKANAERRTETDLAYDGLGSSTLTNWAREVVTITRVPAEGPLTVALTCTKRRLRAGLTERLGSGASTPTVYLRHAKPESNCLLWIQTEKPSEPDDKRQTTYKAK
jgi:hypothetical protein